MLLSVFVIRTGGQERPQIGTSSGVLKFLREGPEEVPCFAVFRLTFTRLNGVHFSFP